MLLPCKNSMKDISAPNKDRDLMFGSYERSFNVLSVSYRLVAREYLA